VTIKWKRALVKYTLALLIASFVSEALFGYRALHNHSTEFLYLTTNLALAWVPIICVCRLLVVLRSKLWSSYEALILSFAWLIFLPNSFYMITDFIHLEYASTNTVVYDSMMLTSFIFTAVVLGMTSLIAIHMRLLQRLSMRYSNLLIGLTMFVCSVAMYFGRDLRWNSWDVLINPGGLLVDISERVEHITSYPDMIIEILAFFFLLTSIYYLFWTGLHLVEARQD
jgi:uncharacterized membrane protein